MNSTLAHPPRLNLPSDPQEILRFSVVGFILALVASPEADSPAPAAARRVAARLRAIAREIDYDAEPAIRHAQMGVLLEHPDWPLTPWAGPTLITRYRSSGPMIAQLVIDAARQRGVSMSPDGYAQLSPTLKRRLALHRTLTRDDIVKVATIGGLRGVQKLIEGLGRAHLVEFVEWIGNAAVIRDLANYGPATTAKLEFSGARSGELVAAG